MADPTAAPVGTPAPGNVLANPAAVEPAKVAEPVKATEPAKPVTTEPPKVAANILGDKPKEEGEPAKTEPKKDDKPPVELKAEDYKFTPPEGVTIDEGLSKPFANWAAKNKLSQEAAQALFADAGGEITKLLTAPYETWKSTQETWQTTVKADPEIGGAKLDGVISTIHKAIDQFGGDKGIDAAAFREALTFTGAGNNPAVIRVLSRMAKAVTEATPVNPNPGGAKRDPASLLYPSTQGDGSGQPRTISPISR